MSGRLPVHTDLHGNRPMGQRWQKQYFTDSCRDDIGSIHSPVLTSHWLARGSGNGRQLDSYDLFFSLTIFLTRSYSASFSANLLVSRSGFGWLWQRSWAVLEGMKDRPFFKQGLTPTPKCYWQSLLLVELNSLGLPEKSVMWLLEWISGELHSME